MQVITTRNVHDALPAGIELLKLHGVDRETRNGPVRVASGPVTTHYLMPQERVLLWAQRDANPFFHLFESLWMLAGRSDVAYLAQFVPTIATFSDDGKTFNGAYGKRWRGWFGVEGGVIDQLLSIINILRCNPDDRRCVLQMWDASNDLGLQSKDLPCNTQVYFSVSPKGKLDMTVCNRSNDIIWGAYGANAVHFSVLQEIVAAGVGVPMGGYWQMSNNYHGYLTTLEPLMGLADMAPDPFRTVVDNPYQLGMKPYPLVLHSTTQWLAELQMFLDESTVMNFREPFFRKVAWPMLAAHGAYKSGQGVARYDEALRLLSRCEAIDWRTACEEWINRRRLRHLDKAYGS